MIENSWRLLATVMVSTVNMEIEMLGRSDVPAGSGLSSLTFKAANALLPPLSSHFRQARWEQAVDYSQLCQIGTRNSI